MWKGGWLLSSLMMMRIRCVDSLLAVDSSYVMASYDREGNSSITLIAHQVAIEFIPTSLSRRQLSTNQQQQQQPPWILTTVAFHDETLHLCQKVVKRCAKRPKYFSPQTLSISASEFSVTQYLFPFQKVGVSSSSTTPCPCLSIRRSHPASPPRPLCYYVSELRSRHTGSIRTASAVRLGHFNLKNDGYKKPQTPLSRLGVDITLAATCATAPELSKHMQISSTASSATPLAGSCDREGERVTADARLPDHHLG
ncbi:hypothetical protein IWZ01DRAFT_38221 [Phyllosticta capitalensis]